MKDRREKGLCYHCDEKFFPGHNCKKLFILQGDWIEDNNVEDELKDILEAGGEYEQEIPSISYHAFFGAMSTQTMKMYGTIRKQKVLILIDSGSTHNFLSIDTASKLQLPISTKERLTVVVGNGDKLHSQGHCSNVELQVQQHQFQVDFYLLSLHDYEVVLGTQWLSTVGPILWDFAKLTMTFKMQEKEIKLQGLTNILHQYVDPRKMSKAALKAHQGFLFQLNVTPNESQLQVAGDFELGKQLQTLLQQYEDLFQESLNLPPVRAADHRIPLVPGAGAVAVRTYRYPYYQKIEIEKQIRELLSAGVIRPSNSPFSSPVILVKKKDNSWRMCIDYRALNKVTVKDKFPIPNIDELLDELHDAKFFSKLDLRSGYHQIRMHVSDVYKTAFRTHQGHYEFLVMPFGLSNAPATFQALMNEIFQEFLRRFVLVFFDDILVYSQSWSEHLQHLESVFMLLRKNQLRVKREKCQFGQKQIHYLGHIISEKGVDMDPTKIESILSWPQPVTLKGLRGFLGLTGYYRKFIQHYGRTFNSIVKEEFI